MTLEVGDVSVEDAQIDSISEKWADLFDQASQELSLDGFDNNLPEPACEFPAITPDDYITLEGDAYSKLMAKVDYWFSRAHQHLAWAESELILREAQYKDIVRDLKNALREMSREIKKTERPTETELKETAESHQLPRELQQRIVYLRAKQKVLNGYIASFERFANGLSRQITYRGQGMDASSKSSRVAGPRRFSR